MLVRLLKYARKYWIYLFFSILAIFGMTASQLYAPLVVRELTRLATQQDPDLAPKALRMGGILLVVYLFQAGCMFVRSYFTHYAAWNFVGDMRVMIYNKLQSLSYKYYHDKQTGQLMSTVVNSTHSLEMLIAHAVPDVIVNIIIFFGVFFVLFTINPILAGLSLITVPFLFISARGYAVKVLPLFKQAQRFIAELNAKLQDNFSGIKEIQVFNRQDHESNEVKKRADEYTHVNVVALKFGGMYHSSVQLFSNMGTVFVIAYGGYLASIGKVPIEDIVAFIMYLGIFYQPITLLARVNEDIQTSLAGADRIFKVLDAESDIKEAENATALGAVSGNITFDNVSFNYIQNIDVLKNINIDIKSGEIVALVGPTGVGKTTFISLISRFYDPVEGNIYFDGVNIKDVTLNSLRDNISIVLQDVFLFNGTVADNIAYGFKSATREQVIAAAKVAKAHDFICKFENGYDTVVGERGVILSGGQKQRISIARAVLRDKPILILDEATASVDVETEKLIHEAMDEVMENRTTIIIAHRLSTVKKADKIVVLNEGVIEDIGTHAELLERDGLYAYLSNIQFSEREVTL